MKTKELLEILKQADPESDVLFQIDSGCCGDYLELEPYDGQLEEWQDHKTKEKIKWVSIHFEHLPGYFSCRQVGKTMRDNEEYWTKFSKPERKYVGPISPDHEDKELKGDPSKS